MQDQLCVMGVTSSRQVMTFQLRDKMTPLPGCGRFRAAVYAVIMVRLLRQGQNCAE